MTEPDIFRLLIGDAAEPPDVTPPVHAASIELKFADRALYEKIVGVAEPPAYYTITQTFDLNPWHRKSRTLRGRALKLWSGVGWTLRGLFRRPRTQEIVLTFPNARFESGPGVDGPPPGV